VNEETVPERIAILWAPEARVDVRAIDRETAMRILHCIDDYTSKRVGGVKKLKPPRAGFRLRCGDYRVFFEYTRENIIAITGVRNRKQAYRGARLSGIDGSRSGERRSGAARSPTVGLICPSAIRMKLYLSRRQSVSRMDLWLGHAATAAFLPNPPNAASTACPNPFGYVNLCVSILRSPKVMFRSLAIRAGLLCFVLAPLATVASAQLKIAVVNVQKAMLDSDELKKVSADVEAKYKPKQDELLKLQNELQSIQQQLQSNKLTPQAQQDLQLQGQRRQRDAQRLSDDLQQEFDRDRQDILGKAAAKMTEVVKKLAEEKGFDIVIDVSQSLYFKPALDVTADALAAYNKAYPVAK